MLRRCALLEETRENFLRWESPSSLIVPLLELYSE